MRRKLICYFLLLILIPIVNIDASDNFFSSQNLKKNNFYEIDSYRNEIEDLVIISDSDPFYGILGSYVSCWYDNNKNISELLPLLILEDRKLNSNQEFFVNKYRPDNDEKLLIIGENDISNYEKNEFFGTPSDISVDLSTYVFKNCSSVLIMPYNGKESYQLSLLASPIASYLNIPILIFDDNINEIRSVCNNLGVENAIVIGDIEISFEDISIIDIASYQSIQAMILDIIKNRFDEISYLTLTNPADVINVDVKDSYDLLFSDHFENIKLTILGREFDLKGSSKYEYNLTLPDGINVIKIDGKIIKDETKPLNIFEPIIYIYLLSPDGNVVAYSNSHAFKMGEVFLETQVIKKPGDYKILVDIYNGFKGGFFVQRGFSFIDDDFELNVNVSTMNSSHMPLISKLSVLAPYLTSAHGGIIITDPGFSLTDDSYSEIAEGTAGGPSFNEYLHDYNNQKVNYSVEKLSEVLTLLENYDLLDSYLDGPAWLGILADSNMVPMYYYAPSQSGIFEKGLTSDNPYYLDFNLSVGRIIGWNVQDVSLLLSRTFFYENICGEPLDSNDWHNRFNFIMGEGFGETGGIFHQIPYSLEIKKYGFKSKVFGDFRNSRQLAEMLEAYIGSNYIEYLGHADWFWFIPSIYGFDYYSKAIDVAHVRNWFFEKPSVFLTSACLMGRVDGIPPESNIGLTLLHAGCNGFVGATRETGQEAGLTELENHLIVDDFSLGEALRGEKRIDRVNPTFFVRTFYGDPAFNPYEPNNGFSDQGRPKMALKN